MPVIVLLLICLGLIVFCVRKSKTANTTVKMPQPTAQSTKDEQMSRSEATTRSPLVHHCPIMSERAPLRVILASVPIPRDCFPMIVMIKSRSNASCPLGFNHPRSPGSLSQYYSALGLTTVQCTPVCVGTRVR